MTTAYAPGAFADGARPGAVGTTAQTQRDGVVERAHKAASRIRTNEGLRGYSVRTQVLVRYVGYFFLTLVSFIMAKWSFAAIPQWRHGGEMLLYSVCTILTVGCIGSVMYADARDEINRSARQYAFGIVALPGAALSVFMRIVSQALESSSGEDMFVSMLRGNGLPLMYMTLVIIPVFVFVKYIFGGIRSQNRSGMANEEFMSTYLRQDGIQR
jgi:phosphotransferase system  glucose/maltose/N-acetylglucosamine-specific IIC component